MHFLFSVLYASEGMITAEICSETEQTEEAERFIEQLNEIVNNT